VYFVLDSLQKSVASKQTVPELAARALNLPQSEIGDLIILRESLDARKKNNLKWVYQAAVKLVSGTAPAGSKEYALPVVDFASGEFKPKERPLIVGAGPAGLFAAFTLLKKGVRPVILEQGKPVAERIKDVETLWQKGTIDPRSNVVSGEGGAGAFSDGKLTARNRSPEADFFFRTLVEFGAPPEIAWQAKPHLGTDRLVQIIPRMTDYLKTQGADFHYSVKITGLEKKAHGLLLKADEGEWSSDCVILAVGHSADDFYNALQAQGVSLVKKTFAVGVRIEHPREFVDTWQYGEQHDATLTGAADYKLTAEIEAGRGAYSFCVCPGGRVINASSANGRVSVNGMSMSARDSDKTNGAIVVTVLPEDLPDHPLAGLMFRKEIEEKCAAQGGLFAPCQKAVDFLKGEKSKRIESTYRPGYFSADLNLLLPEKIVSGLKKSFYVFDRQIRGFIDKGMLVAPETGTSSPVRILRDPETFESVNCNGLFPIGEGAGYAGGIVSSAVDGIRLALKFRNA